MELLQEVDPEGVAARKSKSLKRRVYHNKVLISVRSIGLMYMYSCTIGSKFCLALGRL